MHLLVATQSDVLLVNPDAGTATLARGLDDRPTCLAADPRNAGPGVVRHAPGWRVPKRRRRRVLAVRRTPHYLRGLALPR
jgi:hypothetical protein